MSTRTYEQLTLKWRKTEPRRKPRVASNGDGVRNTMRHRFMVELQQRPGEWARYPRVLSRAGFRHSYEHDLPGTEWRELPREDGRCDAWARWVGTGNGDAVAYGAPMDDSTTVSRVRDLVTAWDAGHMHAHDAIAAVYSVVMGAPATRPATRPAPEDVTP